MIAAVRAPAPVRVVWDGQSHNIWPLTNLYDHRGPIPNRTMTTTGAPWANIAIGDTGWGALAATVATRRNPHARNRPGCTDVLVMNGGQADIYNDGQTGAQAYARAVAYASTARAAGFTKIIGVTFPAVGIGDPAAVAAHNTLMRSGSDFDAVADLGAVMTDFTDRRFYESDRVHFTAAGATKAARVMAATLEAFL